MHEANWREREVGSYPQNSIVGDSKDIKKSTVSVRRRKITITITITNNNNNNNDIFTVYP